MPSLDSAKKKTEVEAKKGVEGLKKVEAKVVKEAKVVGADAKKAGHKLVDETEKAAKKVKEKV